MFPMHIDVERPTKQTLRPYFYLLFGNNKNEIKQIGKPVLSKSPINSVSLPNGLDFGLPETPQQPDCAMCEERTNPPFS